MRRSTLSPRAAAGAFEDLASRGRLIGRQRVDRSRLRRRVARRARVIAGRAGLVALGVVALGVSGLLAGWLLKSPRFAVSSVEVSGQSRLSREAIETAAAHRAGQQHLHARYAGGRRAPRGAAPRPARRGDPEPAEPRGDRGGGAAALHARPRGTAALDRRAGHRPRVRGAGRRPRHARHQRPRRGRSRSPTRPVAAPPPGSACCGCSCARARAC